MCIQAGVIEHVLRYWALTPICPLEAFVQADIENLVQQITQTRLLPAECAGGDACIEQVNELEIKIPSEAEHVVFSAMQDFDDPIVGEYLLQRAHIAKAEWINQVVDSWNGDLNQTDLFLVSVQTIGFGIDGDRRLFLQAIEQFLEGGRILDQSGWTEGSVGHAAYYNGSALRHRDEKLRQS